MDVSRLGREPLRGRSNFPLPSKVKREREEGSILASKLQLSIICGSNERVAPVLNGEVEVEGVELIHTKSDPSETFWRQLNFEEFEISEMSMSSYLIAKDQGTDMVMIPVYPTRRWFHTELQMHVDAGIETPSANA